VKFQFPHKKCMEHFPKKKKGAAKNWALKKISENVEPNSFGYSLDSMIYMFYAPMINLCKNSGSCFSSEVFTHGKKSNQINMYPRVVKIIS
jgi:hypothetical protein